MLLVKQSSDREANGELPVTMGVRPVRRGRSSPTAGFAIALVAAALSIAVATLLPEPKEEVSGAVGALIDTPLPGGTVMPLQDAVRAADFPLYRASMPLASDDTILEVWVRAGDSPEVLILYETGVVSIIEPDSLGITLQEYPRGSRRMVSRERSNKSAAWMPSSLILVWATGGRA